MFKKEPIKVIEDFSPINHKYALLVCGESYNNLNQIVKVKYEGLKWKEDKVLKLGTYLRLGNIFNDRLIYSDNYTVFEDHKFLVDGIQPYKYDGGLLYQHHGVIFLDDEIIVKSPTVNHLVVGRPSYYKGKVYYETRQHVAPLWEVWHYDLQTNIDTFVIDGCNPFMYDDILYYQVWNSKTSGFDLEYREL